MNRWDVLVIAGALCVAIGAGLIYIPAGLIAGGLGIVALGIVGAIGEARAEPPVERKPSQGAERTKL